MTYFHISETRLNSHCKMIYLRNENYEKFSTIFPLVEFLIKLIDVLWDFYEHSLNIK
jgi:hypothetical protein